MSVLAQLENLIETGGLAKVFIGPSSDFVRPGAKFFCTLTNSRGESNVTTGSGRGATIEQAVEQAVRDYAGAEFAPRRRMPGMD